MAINYPGPYEVRIFQTTSSITHQNRLNVRLSGTPSVGDIFNTILALDRDDNSHTLDSQVDALVAVLRPQFSGVDTTFDYAELWKYEPSSFDASYVSTYTIGLAGSSVSNAVLASQLILTFRTEEGGVMRFMNMEHASTSNSRIPYASLGAVAKAVADEILDPDSVWLGRDTSYPVSCISGAYGQNEALFRQRYR